MPYIPPMPDEPLVVRVFDRCVRGWLVSWWSLLDIVSNVYRHYRPRPEINCGCRAEVEDDTAWCLECHSVKAMWELEPVYNWLKLCHKWGLETTWRCRDREFCAEEADHG